ncbi:hypothetical protein [Lysobacter gummosus]|uniref:hypothetical protein n=1 Tax=Lysobacter gummosus TaxID=262324 RepID=UPI0036381038
MGMMRPRRIVGRRSRQVATADHRHAQSIRHSSARARVPAWQGDNIMRTPRFAAAALWISIALALGACGGGGKKHATTSSTPTPSPNTSPTPSRQSVDYASDRATAAAGGPPAAGNRRTPTRPDPCAARSRAELEPVGGHGKTACGRWTRNPGTAEPVGDRYRQSAIGGLGQWRPARRAGVIQFHSGHRSRRPGLCDRPL